MIIDASIGSLLKEPIVHCLLATLYTNQALDAFLLHHGTYTTLLYCCVLSIIYHPFGRIDSSPSGYQSMVTLISDGIFPFLTILNQSINHLSCNGQHSWCCIEKRAPPRVDFAVQRVLSRAVVYESLR
jgi:hypothetical protein